MISNRGLRRNGAGSCAVPPQTPTPIWDKAEDLATSLRVGLPATAIENHEKLLSHSEKLITKSAKNAVEVEEVTKAVEKALTARFPKSRYLVGSDAKVAAALLRVVPDRLRTRLVRQI